MESPSSILAVTTASEVSHTSTLPPHAAASSSGRGENLTAQVRSPRAPSAPTSSSGSPPRIGYTEIAPPSSATATRAPSRDTASDRTGAPPGRKVRSNLAVFVSQTVTRPRSVPTTTWRATGLAAFAVTGLVFLRWARSSIGASGAGRSTCATSARGVEHPTANTANTANIFDFTPTPLIRRPKVPRS